MVLTSGTARAWDSQMQNPLQGLQDGAALAFQSASLLFISCQSHGFDKTQNHTLLNIPVRLEKSILSLLPCYPNRVNPNKLACSVKPILCLYRFDFFVSVLVLLPTA